MQFNFFNRSFNIFTNELQREKFFNFIFAYLAKPAVLAISIISIIYFLNILIAKCKKKYIVCNKLLKLMPLWYFLVILSFSILNRDTGTRELRLQFDYWFASDISFHESNVILDVINMLYYIPFGLVLYRYINVRKKFCVTLLTGFFTSVFMELFQFIFAKGISAINDVIFNAIGTVIGAVLCMCYYVLNRKYKIDRREE